MSRRAHVTRPVRSGNLDDLKALGGWGWVEEVAAFLDCSAAQLYRDVADGRAPFPVLRIGRKIRIPIQPILALLGDGPAKDDQAGSTGARAPVAAVEPSGEVRRLRGA